MDKNAKKKKPSDSANSQRSDNKSKQGDVFGTPGKGAQPTGSKSTGKSKGGGKG